MERRRCERTREGVVEYWEIRREGIRCFTAWGREGGSSRGSTMTLDDDREAQRHLRRKLREKLRQGYVEVPPPLAPASAPPGRLLDRMRNPEVYLPVDGRDEVRVFSSPHPGGPGPFRRYLLLRDEGRCAVALTVKDRGADPEAVSAFLDFLDSRRDLAFDGQPHHKVALPVPVGRFTHALFCSPSLTGMEEGVALAFPIHGCEIGDTDTEVLVDARIKGRASLPYSDWGREPWPVTDLRFDLSPANGEGFARLRRPAIRSARRFKVYRRGYLDTLLEILPEATADSWLEIRSFRGERMTLAPGDLTPGTATEVDRFLLGGTAGG